MSIRIVIQQVGLCSTLKEHIPCPGDIVDAVGSLVQLMVKSGEDKNFFCRICNLLSLQSNWILECYCKQQLLR